MSAKVVAPVFKVTVRRSRWWLILLVVLMLLECSVVALFKQSLMLLTLLWPLWQVLAYANWAGHCPTPDCIEVLGKRVILHYGDSEVLASVSEDSIAWPWLIVLNLRVVSHRVSVTLWPDSAPANARRQLRVYLRWYAVPHKEDQLYDGNC